MLLLLFIPLTFALNLHKAQDKLDVPETNLDTLFSAYMYFENPKAPSETMKAAYKSIIHDCIPDQDTVMIGIYLDDTKRKLHIRHVQTSVPGHEEHMNNGFNAVQHMIEVSEGMVGKDTYLGGPKHVLQQFRASPELVKVMPLANPADFIQFGAKKHKFTEMNHQQKQNFTFVMLDPIIKLPNGLTPAVEKVVKKIITHAENTPGQVSFDVLYRSEDKMLTFREIYKGVHAAESFRENTKELTKSLGSMTSQTIAGPAYKVAKLKAAWAADENNSKTTYYNLYDGFQRVQSADKVASM